MPVVKVQREIKAPIDRVYSLAKDIENFPNIMPDVEEVEVLSRDGSKLTSRWVGVVRQFNRKLRWTEADDWDDENHTCTFEQVEGDFTVYRGSWAFAETDEGTLAELELDHEINVPLIGPLIRGVIAKLVRKNCDSMLEALAKEAEGS